MPARQPSAERAIAVLGVASVFLCSTQLSGQDTDAVLVGALRSQCMSSPEPRRGGTVGGLVSDAAGRPAGAVAIIVSWDTDSATGRPPARETLGTYSDAVGWWRICDVPLHVPLVIRASAAVGSGEVTI